ncbi:MAG: amidohydrolase family protein [Mobiluncus porci]|uniref:amidohydrolase family protein n=1 Tax=Mobiluncus TaxID=2050 RepID=UPI0023F0C0D2|nr:MULTISPECIES: amidohydrolase family protein [Mobiluncus]MCI6583660.1 amidohydrolase family protein [Mobiluncus sp.]MDD7541149.1 amidohydrolase family protein [Mobiluncus porci]MDY5748037.1 amidohydrolase family protein [Mobiluncus porci]
MGENLKLRGSFQWRDGDAGAAPTWVEGELFVHDGVVSRRPKQGAVYRELSGFAIPGLTDVHCHVGVSSAGAVDRETQREQASADRDAGILLIRDCGAPTDTHWIDEELSLPKIIRCGQHLARPKRYMRHYGLELESQEELPEEVARQAKFGDGWVKIVGDWIDRSEGADSDLKPLWGGDVMRDAIAAAHENGARVTVHTFAHDTIDTLLDAGVDCIEHGTGMDSDQIAEAARRGIPVTPTLLQIERFGDFADQAGEKYPVYAATMARMDARNVEHQAELAAAGVQLLPGTDAGGYQHHGSLPVELARWTELGLSAREILDFATWRVRDYLGAPVLSEGAPADVVVYGSDPRADITVLQRPETVILRGAVV